ncbi:UNVERIFIED_CONTAM: hypothetical protein Slati_1108400 [Sesamum latifolium]|uniref:RNase H type-1 domain-containing protein n=1 Tax=Sesamum latifolium TaxID=2727402 RepID=A0AAW2XBE1_9LAMI
MRNPGISGAGGILRDHLGRVIFAFQEPLGNTINTQAKLRAIHRGLQICTDKGHYNIWIETDATAIIKLIFTPKQGAWNLQTTLQSIRKLLSQMDYRISHVFREDNQAADFLVNQTCNVKHPCILQEDALPGKVKGATAAIAIFALLCFAIFVVVPLSLLYCYCSIAVLLLFGCCFAAAVRLLLFSFQPCCCVYCLLLLLYVTAAVLCC